MTVVLLNLEKFIENFFNDFCSLNHGTVFY